MGEAKRRKELSSPWMSGRKRWPDAVTILLRDFCALLGAPDISRAENDLLHLPVLPATQDEAKLLIDIGPITYLCDGGQFKFCAGFAESELRRTRPHALPDDDGCLPGRRSEADYRAHVLAARIDEFINAQTDSGGDDLALNHGHHLIRYMACMLAGEGGDARAEGGVGAPPVRHRATACGGDAG
jgi:hypothetical protein